MSSRGIWIAQGLCSELALVDVAKDKLRGEKMDLEHGKAFLKQVTVKCVPCGFPSRTLVHHPRPPTQGVHGLRGHRGV